MSEADLLLEEATKHVQRGDHMLTVSYAAIKDEKMLLSVALSLARAAEKAAQALIATEKPAAAAKKQNPQHLLNYLENHREKLGLTQRHVQLTHKLLSVKAEHESSPIEFKRKDKYVIANNNYHLRTLNEDGLKTDIKDIKALLETTKKYVENSS